MCLILDTQIIRLVLASNGQNEFEPVRRSLFAKRAIAVHGGDLTREYLKLAKLTKVLSELDRQGILRKVPDTLVDTMTQAVRTEGRCVSNDEHIIALARVANVRLLCSLDKDLHNDFTNPRLLKPRGIVYQQRAHQHLITKHCSKNHHSQH